MSVSLCPTGSYLLRYERSQSSLLPNFMCHSDARAHNLPVLFGGKKVLHDDRRGARIGGFQLHIAPALRTQ